MNQGFGSDNLSKQLIDLANKEFFNAVGKSWGIKNPNDMLKECIKNKEWFKGVVLSASFLEGVGAKVLSLRFGSQINPKKIGRLSLDTIIILLYASKIIEHSTYLNLMEVKKYRNDIVHLKQSPFTEPKPQRTDSKRIIKIAIECLNRLIFELQDEGREFLLTQNK